MKDVNDDEEEEYSSSAISDSPIRLTSEQMQKELLMHQELARMLKKDYREEIKFFIQNLIPILTSINIQEHGKYNELLATMKGFITNDNYFQYKDKIIDTMKVITALLDRHRITLKDLQIHKATINGIIQKATLPNHIIIQIYQYEALIKLVEFITRTHPRLCATYINLKWDLYNKVVDDLPVDTNQILSDIKNNKFKINTNINNSLKLNIQLENNSEGQSSKRSISEQDDYSTEEKMEIPNEQHFETPNEQHLTHEEFKEEKEDKEEKELPNPQLPSNTKTLPTMPNR